MDRTGALPKQGRLLREVGCLRLRLKPNPAEKVVSIGEEVPALPLRWLGGAEKQHCGSGLYLTSKRRTDEGPEVHTSVR